MGNGLTACVDRMFSWWCRLSGMLGQLCVLGLCGIGSRGYAQSLEKSSSWQAMRVYVPEDQVDAVVTPDYLTIDSDDLERLLAEESRRRAQSSGQAVGIQRATYIARWADQMLVSAASCWHVNLPENSVPLGLGRMSVALEEAAQLPENEPAGATRSVDGKFQVADSLLSHLRFVDENRLQLSDVKSQANYWFGFKVKSERGDTGGQSLMLELPRAALATMLIAVPANVRLSSDLPCVRTNEPDAFLPENWPMNQRPRLSADEHWYVVHLSGRDSCRLQLESTWQPSQLPYRLSVASAQCDMRVDAAGLSVSARFQLGRVSSGSTVRLMLDAPLHVRSIQVNGVVSMPWRTVADDSGKPAKPGFGKGNRSRRGKQFVDVILGDLSSNSALVTVDAVAPLALTYLGNLPSIEIAEAYVLDGRSTLTSEDHIEIADLQCEGARLTSSTDGGSALWQWPWAGKPPKVRVRLRGMSNQWTLRSLTRFNLQTDVVVAAAHVQLSSETIQGNQVSLKLADGWFVDSVSLDNGPQGVSTEIRQIDGQSAELCVRWEDRHTSLDLRLAINAHFPQRTEVDNLRLQSTRLVTLPGADQADTYVIEPSGRFQLAVDPELLRLRVTEEDLIPWQRELLPRLEDVWIFRGGRSNLPVVRLQRVRATLSARLSTVVTQTDQETLIAYRILCQPISGSLDQFRLLLPIPDDVVAPTWSLVPQQAETAKRQVLVNSLATSTSAGETMFTLDLAQDLAEPFTIEAELRLPKAGPALVIPLPSIPQAISQDATLDLPPGLTLPQQELPGLELLPRRWRPAEAESLGGELDKSADSIAVRYDPNVVSHLQVQATAAFTRGVWVKSEVHQHWYHHGGRMVHRSQWDFVVPAAREVDIHLPQGWRPESLKLQNRQVEWLQPDSSSLKIMLPPGNSVSVQLDCTSHEPAALWGWQQILQPNCGLAAADKQQTVWMPGTILAGTGPYRPSANSSIARWWPVNWWRWLSMDALVWSPELPQLNGVDAAGALSATDPSVPVVGSDESLPPGYWWSIQLEPQSERIWYVERSWFIAQLVAVVLLLVVVLSLINGRQFVRWWISWLLALSVLGAIPTEGLPYVQLVCVALALATLIAISRLAIQWVQPSQKSRETVASSLLAVTRTAMGPIVLIGLQFSGLGGVSAQAPTRTTAEDRDEVFGILIPVDRDNQVAGDYVYVPTRMSRLLSNANQPEATGQTVTLKTAFYSIRIINDQFTMTSSLGELTAELTIHSPRVGAELSLPFAGNELALQRAFLDSRELVIGDSLRQDDQRVIFRADDSDRHVLRLIFKPQVINEKDGRGSLTVRIPPIPTARLEVMGDDLRDVVVDAIGGTQLDSPRFLMAQLGPTRQLSLTWPLSFGRASNLQVSSDTWIHSRGEQLMALCQLRIRGAAALPGVIHVVGDSSWQPVGHDWQDGQLLSINGAVSSGRPIYRVQRSLETADDSQTLRVLLLPREQPSVATLPIPFLSLQEAAPQQRTLALSHADSATWKQVGTESWQPLLASQVGTIWEKGRLADQPSLMRVPAGTLFASLQRLPPATLPTAEETTEISVQVPDIRVKYMVKWNQPIVGQSCVRIQIPSAYQVDSALIDALPARFASQRLVKLSATSEVVVFVDSARGAMQSVQLQLSSPMRLNRDWAAPRPLLQNWRISSSRVRIYRGPEVTLNPQLLADDCPALQPLEVTASPMLLGLQAPVGQVDLGERFRESSELPYTFRLTRTASNRPVQAVVQLMRSETGWKAQLDAVVAASPAATDHLFFDLPSSLAASFREPLEVNAPLLVWPAADSNRAILCVLPQATAGGAGRVSLTVRLPTAGASQSINLPDIRVLGASTQRPFWALPKSVSGEPVTWSQVGRPLGNNWQPSSAWEGQTWDGYTLYDPGINQFQAVWQTKQSADVSARLLLTRLLLRPLAGEVWSGQIDYWVAPRGHSYLTARIPSNCDLIGVEVGGQPVPWQQEEKQIRLLMRPNSLPVPIRLQVRWTGQSTGGGQVLPLSLGLPQLDAQATGTVLVGIADAAGGGRSGEFLGGSLLSVSEARQVAADSWSALLIQAAAQPVEWQADELAAWYAMWNPSMVGLGQALDVTVAKPPGNGEESPADSAGGFSVESLWQELARPVPSASSGQRLDTTRTADTDDRVYQWYEVTAALESPVLQIQPRERPAGRPAWLRLGAALAALLIGIFSWLISLRWLRRPFEFLGEAVWPLWLALASLASVLLPVWWPGAFIALCAIIIVCRRLSQFKRDRQFVFAPRSPR